MKRVLSRLLLILLAASTGIGLYLYSDYYLKRYYRENLRIRSELQSLQTDLYALKGDLLRNASFLYYSYDNLHRFVRRIQSRLDRIESNPHFQDEAHSASQKRLESFQKDFRDYTKELERYLSLNSSLKNSIIYLPTLQLRAFSLFDAGTPREKETLLLLSRINASIFLAKNAQDTDFLEDLKSNTLRLSREIQNYEGARKRLLSTFREHLWQFIRNFRPYLQSLDRLIGDRLLQESAEIISVFQKEDQAQFKTVNRISTIILLLYLTSLVVVAYFLLRIDRENRRLRQVQEELERTLITDQLTGLGNRIAYRREKVTMSDPVLILVNIDRFKHINEFYGTRVGDGVLQGVAKILERITPPSLQATLYRMGGDDFGILFERTNCSLQLTTLLHNFHESLEECQVVVEELTIDLSFALGASDRKNWLFETADMALKSAKSSPRKRYALYTPDMDKREEIAQNIQAIRSIRKAIVNESLVPYFQPICQLSNRQITRYEALARIELDEGRHILQPYGFIRAATEAKLSGEITLKILEQTLEMAQRHPFDFSVNITAADVSDKEDRERIIQLLHRYRQLGNRLIFEILESEEIRDYESTAEFIRIAKRYGCRIAIDDFGSGYSNFEKILQLDIDMIKVDGSLIRRIDHDRHSELIVQTILEFAKHAGWETVAEFVHSKSVYDKVSTMGFDYLQGYYIGKPSRTLQTELFQIPRRGDR